MRRSAKDGRVLFHYNGRGVPRPSSNGEIWFFNQVSSFFIFIFIFQQRVII